MSLFLAAYDIRRNYSRSQVAKILLCYGRRVQRSVFEIDLAPEELADLKRDVGPWLEATDLFDVFPLDLRRPQGRLRWQSPPYSENVRLF